MKLSKEVKEVLKERKNVVTPLIKRGIPIFSIPFSREYLEVIERHKDFPSFFCNCVTTPSLPLIRTGIIFKKAKIYTEGLIDTDDRTTMRSLMKLTEYGNLTLHINLFTHPDIRPYCLFEIHLDKESRDHINNCIKIAAYALQQIPQTQRDYRKAVEYFYCHGSPFLQQPFSLEEGMLGKGEEAKK